MASLSRDVSEAELAVLNVLWEQGPSSIRQITTLLYPEGTPSQYATVQKLLERLEGKQCVTRDRAASVHIFRAIIERDTLVGRRLQAVAESLCDGSFTPLLTHLVRAQQLSPEERDALRSLIDDLENDPPSKKEGRKTKKKEP